MDRKGTKTSIRSEGRLLYGSLPMIPNLLTYIPYQRCESCDFEIMPRPWHPFQFTTLSITADLQNDAHATQTRRHWTVIGLDRLGLICLAGSFGPVQRFRDSELVLISSDGLMVFDEFSSPSFNIGSARTVALRKSL